MRRAWLATLALLAASADASEETVSTTHIRELRLRGELAQAQSLAEQQLGAAETDARRDVELRLELARIHDRIGLHHNTRPVAAALEHIEAAAAIAEGLDTAAAAPIELARADYHYRAEMAEREFPTATDHAKRAIDLYQQLGDKHGEAEAVHRLGLIHLQRRELDQARELFERSLDLDRAGGERPFFRGEYERHVGFIYLLRGDTEASVPYLERSLTFRRQAGAVDASLFAAQTLASALVDLGRLDEATPHLLYALMVAEKIDSPTGKARVGLVLGRLHEEEGDRHAARLAYQMTLDIARAIGSASMTQQASDALENLERPTSR